MHSSISRAIFGATQKFSGAPLFERMRELNDSQWLPRARISEQQFRRLSALLHYAYRNVPYYRKQWDEAGIKPGDIQSFDDLKRLPVLTKPVVQRQFDDLQSAAMKGARLHRGKTSGSTSSPMQYVRTQDSKARFWAAQYRGYGWYGIRPGDKQGRFYGMPFAQVNSGREKLKDFVMNRRRLGRFDLSEARMRDFAQRMNRFRPVYFNGYSSWLGRFAEFIEQQEGAAYDWIPLKGAVATSEVLTEQHRETIERAFGCKVIQEYGSAEIGLVAISCPSGGFHTVPENVYLEQLPAGKDVQSPSGTPLYEVVVTDLHSYAMPFIRYKVGDYLGAVSDSDRICECGRESTLIGSVLGRTNSYVITPEGSVIGGMLFDYIAKTIAYGKGISGFAARQKDLRTIILYIARAAAVSEGAVDTLVAASMSHLSPSMHVEVEFVDELPRTSTGKAINFSSDLDLEATLLRIRHDKGTA